MHSVHKVVDFQLLGQYRVKVRFADGVDRIIDFEPVLYGELFGPLRDLDLFSKVTLDRCAHTLVWPNGADFDPETLHEWYRYEAAMVAMAKTWNAGSLSAAS